MKYHNINRHYAVLKSKRLPAKRGRNKQTKSATYQLKFYALIAIIFASTFFYIRYKISHEPKSVFSKIANAIEIEKDKSIVKKNSTKLAITKDETNPKKIKKKVISTAKDAIIKKEISVFLPQSKDKIIIMVSINTTITTDNYYKTLIDKMLSYKNRENRHKPFNIFSDTTKLLKANIEDDVLLLDFNSKFEYNRFGYNGLKTQIQQVLWTVFSNPGNNRPKYVSFLINGKRRTKISGEGLELKPFYSKKDLTRTISLQKNV